jgi:hypothetical protein
MLALALAITIPLLKDAGLGASKVALNFGAGGRACANVDGGMWGDGARRGATTGCSSNIKRQPR